MPITADRGGVTSAQWYERNIETRTSVYLGEVKVRFKLDSKGGGQTDVQVNISPDSFGQILELMLQCDFKATVKAFSGSILKWEKSDSRSD